MAYTLLSDFTGNTTLTAGTYWMPYDINGNGFTLTFNCASGPIIIKRAGDYSFAFTGVINTTNSTSTNKVYWTDKNDDTIGDAISGSTGSPVKSGLSLNSAYIGTCFTNIAITLINHEIRYASNKQFVYSIVNSNGLTTVRTFQYIIFKNCDYNNIRVFESDSRNSDSSYYQYIDFDNTNTLTGTSYLLYLISSYWGFCRSYVDHITVANANCSNVVIYLWGASVNITQTFSYIKIYNAGYFGLQLIDFRTNWVTLTNSVTTILISPSDTNKQKFINCLFDNVLTGYTSSVSCNSYITFDITNCIFKSYTTIFILHVTRTTMTIKNCNFVSNTAFLSASTSNITASYCGYYNNGETYWARGTGDFTADPSFGNYSTSATIDPTFSSYSFPNGYVASAAAYQNTGSDSYGNLNIDTTLYSPDGTKQLVWSKVNPGIYYKFTTLAPGTLQPNEFQILGITF